MKKVGIIGWRGMVGSVLMDRFQTQQDFNKFNTYLFSTSQKGSSAPKFINGHDKILDSHSLEHLKEMDIIVTCQGGAFTKEIHPQLRKTGWSGFWIDAASALRMNEDSIIVLDPINKNIIDKGLNNGIKDFVGGNCTVSLMLMGLGGLFKENLVEWMSSMTYQAASGSGAAAMLELLDQMKYISQVHVENPALSALECERKITANLHSKEFPTKNFGNPLALSLLPWIDVPVEAGRSKEEWKAQVEANKILGLNNQIPIDGTCVRIGALRSHSQGFTIKLKKNVDISTINEIIDHHNEWVELVDNNKEETLSKLTPTYVSGTMKIPVGRVRKMSMGKEYLNAFSVGDQLLWGAAEPLRRTLLMCLS